MNKLQLIRENLKRNIGSEIVIKSNRGRKQKSVTKGVLEQTYQSIFVVRTKHDLNDKILSFTYADVFTKNIEIIFNDVKKVSNQ